MPAPRQIVNPPTAEPSLYGLLSVIQLPQEDGPQWAGGISWQSVCVSGLGGSTYDPCTSPVTTGGSAPPEQGTGATYTPTTYLTVRGATPFTSYVLFECSTVGNEEAQRIATEAMATTGSWQIERSFWTGLAGGQAVVFPHLADDTQVLDAQGLLQSVPVTGGSATTDVAEALGFLEEAIANCNGGVGVIHVPVEAVPTLDAWGLVRVQGQTLRTLNGNRVAAGAGYPGTAPSGAAPAAGTMWMYATGPVFGYLGPVRALPVREALDRGKNTIRMIAQRTSVVAFDCCHAGALFKLGVPYSGTDAG